MVDILMSPEFWMPFPGRLSCYVVAAVVVLLQEVVVWAVLVLVPGRNPSICWQAHPFECEFIKSESGKLLTELSLETRIHGWKFKLAVASMIMRPPSHGC